MHASSLLADLTAPAGILRHVRQYRKKNGNAPSYREMAEHFGCSAAHIANACALLESRGKVRRMRRGLVLLPQR